jgi:predicted nucleic acid-binding protein
MKPVLLDTGPIVALLDPTDSFHELCADAIANIAAPLVTCEAVIAESCHLLRKLPGAPEAALENLASGIFHIPLPLSAHARAVSTILAKYRRHETDLADACLIHLAEQLEVGDILTLDSDFYYYRWAKNNPFRLLIPLA